MINLAGETKSIGKVLDNKSKTSLIQQNNNFIEHFPTINKLDTFKNIDTSKSRKLTKYDFVFKENVEIISLQEAFKLKNFLLWLSEL